MSLGPNCADENLSFNAKQNPVGIVRDPDRGPTKFPVWFQFQVLPDPLQLQIDFDGLVGACLNGNSIPANYCSGSKIGVIGGINDKPVNISVFEWLTPQIKYRRMHIEEVSKAELACLCSGEPVWLSVFVRVTPLLVKARW